jgi:DNA repair protein RecN (Recombination protein N)
MQDLAMVGGRFEVALHALDEGGVHGLEQVEFLVSAHASLAPRPLAKVASGGELSRISLGIQVMTSQVAAVPTLIFDEVDVGIGGGVAEVVGKMLRDLGGGRQVLCITHLPQVAALGGQHWQVAKNTCEGQVVSQITVLDQRQRIEEIARMLGGVSITETTRRHAAEMLGIT